MVKNFVIQSLLSSVLVCAGQAQYQMKFPNSHYLPENWPQHTLELSEKGTFKDIFDSGIRPYYLSNGREYSELEFKHVRLFVQQPNGKSFPEFIVDYAGLTPKPSGLSVLSLTGQAITLKEARETMIKWLPYSDNSTIDLDAFLTNVKAKYASFDDVTFSPPPQEFRLRWFGENKEEFVVWLQKAFSEEVPLRMRLMISWDKLRTRRETNTFYEGSIPTPEGYEPMQETKHHGPDDMSEMKYAKGIAFVPGRGLGGVPHNVSEKSEDNTESSKSRTEKTIPRSERRVSEQVTGSETTKSTKTWGWLVAGLGFATVIWLARLWKSKFFQ